MIHRILLIAALCALFTSLCLHKGPPLPARGESPEKSPPAEVTIAELNKDIFKYDGKKIKVKGIITSYRERVSKGSAATVTYLYYNLKEGNESITIEDSGKKGLRDGMSIKVTGTYSVMRTPHEGTMVYTNSISAEKVEILGKKRD